jgi:predicted metal-dependent hydrolase
MNVEVTRSARRRKTVQARLVGDTLHVSIPARLTKAEEARWVAEMVQRLERRQGAGRVKSSEDLVARAAALSTRYGLPRPASIRWVGNQNARWGSCTPEDGSIRISRKLAGEPSWVLDYVIVHELAHLEVAGHGPAFWRLVQRYPRAERAKGFLLARSWPAGSPEPAEDDEPAIDLDASPPEARRPEASPVGPGAAPVLS